MMDQETAQKILDDGGDYVSIENHESIPIEERTATLDGDFSIKELEAALFILTGGHQHKWEYIRKRSEG